MDQPTTAPSDVDPGNATPNRLYRSRNERMIAGVAGGVAQYFNIDPVLVRLGFVFLALTTGVGLLAYIIMAIIVPERPIGEAEPPVAAPPIGSDRGRELAGYALLAFGALLLASNLGWFRFFNWDQFWPILLIVGGAYLLLKRPHP